MLKIEAYQIAEQINLKRFKADFKHEAAVANSLELFYDLGNGKYLSVYGYGIVVFAGYSELEKSEAIRFLKEYCEDLIEVEFKDDFVVEIGQEPGVKMHYNSIEIPNLNDNVVQIIMLNVAQSVALDFYEDLGFNILSETKKLTDELEKHGKLNISKTDLLKFIGKILNIKNSIIDNLYIFDAPEIVWENEYLEKVDEGLKKQLDLRMRYRDIDYKLKIVQENLTLFTDLVQNKQSHNMELIIVVLILIEVIHLILGYIIH
jgi:required for meiotic nuclear division protein 1